MRGMQNYLITIHHGKYYATGVKMIEQLRKQIDEIDNKILQLIEQRMKIAEDVAKCKNKNNMPITDSNRENEILEKLAGKTKYPGLVESVWKALISQSKSIQKEVMKRKSHAIPDQKEALQIL